MLLHPVQHAVECPARLAALIDFFLFIVEIRVVDTRCTGDKDVYVTRDESFGAISRMSISELEGSINQQKDTVKRTHNRHPVRTHLGKGVVAGNFARCTPV